MKKVDIGVNEFFFMRGVLSECFFYPYHHDKFELKKFFYFELILDF